MVCIFMHIPDEYGRLRIVKSWPRMISYLGVQLNSLNPPYNIKAKTGPMNFFSWIIFSFSFSNAKYSLGLTEITSILQLFSYPVLIWILFL